MIDKEAAAIAANCRHYGMCKIDYLGTGLCPAVEGGQFNSYYPEGRMDIYRALADGALSVTEGLVDVARTCTLCGICDRQCYFVTELRPGRVMQALKDFVESRVRNHGEVIRIAPDPFLIDLRSIVGEKYATNDPAHLVAYATDPSPVAATKMPGYVVLPRTREEIAEIVKLCRARDLPFTVRGNGASTMGFAMSSGVILDTNRMKGVTIDKDRWLAVVEAGVTSFELQRAAVRHGLRANVAEPAATFCGNLMCSGVFSLMMSGYGTCASHCVNAEFVDPEGRAFDLNQRDAPNLFDFRKEDRPLPGICTGAKVKLYPMTEGEEGVLVPFSSFDEALAFAEDLNRRQIGFGIGMLGGEYISVFLAPTRESARKVRDVFPRRLGIDSLVLVLGDRTAVETVKKLRKNIVIDQPLFRILQLGLPNLIDERWSDLLEDYGSDRPAFELFCRPEMRPVLETALAPSPQTLASVVDDDMVEFFAELYERPEMTDLVWLNMFRLLSSRMGREKHFVANIVYVPLDKKEVIVAMRDEFKRIADKHGLKNHLGFITPLDFGKRALLEYDYYLDHTNPDDRERMLKALGEAGGLIEGTSAAVPGIVWIRYLVNQGFSRMESVLYS